MRRAVTGIRLVLAACLLLPLVAYAAGLGRLTLFSGLGEPLRAEVEIVALQPGDDDSLVTRLASPEAFRQAGIEYSPTLLNIRVALERRDGKPVIRLTSAQPVNDPFVDLLLELQWATGRLVREYTFLLDPPGYRERPAVGAAPAPSQAPAAAAAPTPPSAAVEARPLAAEPPGARTYEVKKGDTLGRIARENKPEGVTFHQMLVALYRANPEAFIRKNMNLVRAGRILKIPDSGAVESIAAAEANRVVRTHMAEFAEYRAKLGAAVAAKPATTAPGQREVSGRISAKPETPPSGAPKDQLKLSKADAAKPSSPSARAAREDDKAAAGRALQEAQSRVTDLEKNVTDLQKLLEMKNKQLAQLEQKAGAAPAAVLPSAAKEAAKAAAEAPKPAAEAPKPVAEAAKPAPAAPKPTPDATKAPAAKAKPKPAAPPPPEPSLVDEFLDNPLALGGLGGILVLLAGYGAWAWRRKKATQARFQDSVLGASAGGAAPAKSAAAVPTGAATAAAVSAAVAAAQPAAAVAAADEVDPIAEADVYLAYGRDAQAEEILKEALGKDPDRTEVHAKLLEIFAHRRDTKAFEKSALKIKELTQGAGPEWAKARTLGHSIDPENGLYAVRGAAGESEKPPVSEPSAAAAAAPTLDFDIGGAAPAAGAAAAVSLDLDIGAVAPAAEEKKAFSPDRTVILGPGGVPSASAAQAAGAGAAGGEKTGAAGLDFDLGSLEPPTAPAAAAPAPEEGASLDFDLNLDLGGEKPAAAAQAALDISTISLDLGKPGAATPATSPDAKWQEVATKLDLAKAYQEMGDKDGARELLTEVVNQGDTAQQNQAKQMLAALG
ncbi:MAG: FimV family protein [Betaproteobacteria bacterium]|nr:FimV family protein [Betaproteobacteria bacterium]